MDPPKDVKALADADQCVVLKPDWAKVIQSTVYVQTVLEADSYSFYQGHFRRAQALLSLGRYQEAIDAAHTCAAKDPAFKKDTLAIIKEIQAKR